LQPWTDDLHPAFHDYIEKYHMQDRLSVMPTEELLSLAGESGIDRIVVCGTDRVENKHIGELAHKFEQIIPVGGVSVSSGINHALREITELHDQKFAAVNFGFGEKLNVNDKLFYPLYGVCEYFDIPIIVHSSVHFWRGAYMWKGQPQYFDEIAVDFPALKIIMSHGGNGFGPTVLAVAQRHPNIYLEFSALRPKYMAPEFIQAANTYLKHKCIFGTDYPLIDFSEQVKVWKYSLREEVWPLFFHDNILSALYGKPIPAL
ncbi:MAG TPA: hypothetical protein DHU63_07170, partial [Candidatus Marinimicrobia bacterium]|nr:hypothetical protein [Candidatus Neomarinimicrobiota bacterium]